MFGFWQFILFNSTDFPAKITENTETLADLVSLKLNSDLPKKILLFASMIALQKWWKMLFISS